MTYVKAVLAGAILWVVDGLRGVAQHDPLWREHHRFPKEKR